MSNKYRVVEISTDGRLSWDIQRNDGIIGEDWHSIYSGMTYSWHHPPETREDAIERCSKLNHVPIVIKKVIFP